MARISNSAAELLQKHKQLMNPLIFKLQDDFILQLHRSIFLMKLKYILRLHVLIILMQTATVLELYVTSVIVKSSLAAEAMEHLQ